MEYCARNSWNYDLLFQARNRENLFFESMSEVDIVIVISWIHICDRKRIALLMVLRLDLKIHFSSNLEGCQFIVVDESRLNKSCKNLQNNGNKFHNNLTKVL